MEFTYQQALRIKYDYSNLVGEKFDEKVTDLIIVPAETEFFVDFMDCYSSSKDDILCLKNFNTHRFNMLIIYEDRATTKLNPYESFSNFIKKNNIPFDLNSYRLN